MRPRHLVAVLVAISPTLAYAQEPEAPVEEEEDLAEAYAKKGNIEVGGSIGLAFDDDVTTVTVAPQIGYFAIDRVELSLIVAATYERAKMELSDTVDSTKSGSILFEPSYHYPISDNLLILAGVGVGPGYDEEVELDVVPRVGINIVLPRGSVITPAVRMPLKIGKLHGDETDSDPEDVGVDASLFFTVGVSSVW